jgi:hypothetical protein
MMSPTTMSTTFPVLPIATVVADTVAEYGLITWSACAITTQTKAATRISTSVRPS